jgi:tetratricopeptide (TPR) repeat protein
MKKYEKAIESDANYVEAYVNLGYARLRREELGSAIDLFGAAARFDANHFPAHFQLANSLYTIQDLPGAIAEYRRAVEIEPKNALVHHHLGSALRDSKELLGAIAELSRAVELDEAYAEARHDLGGVLRDVGYHKGAIDQYRTAALLYAERSRPTDDPAVGRRYNAACCAALAAAVHAEDPRHLPEQVALMLRRQALQWLRADLGMYEKSAEREAAATRQALLQWRVDPDLAALRESEALNMLPDGERQAWLRLWAAVDGLLRQVIH